MMLTLARLISQICYDIVACYQQCIKVLSQAVFMIMIVSECPFTYCLLICCYNVLFPLFV